MPEDPDSAAPLVSEPAASLSGATGLPANVAAALAVMIPLLGGIVFLVLERKDRFVRFYALQSIILGILLGAAALMLSLIKLIFSPIPLIGSFVITIGSVIYGIFALGWLVLYFIVLVKAFSGRTWALPYLGGMLKRHLNPKPL